MNSSSDNSPTNRPIQERLPDAAAESFDRERIEVVREARQVLQDVQATRLSHRDRDRFLAALDAADAKPNAALKAAARRYGKLRG